MWSLRNGTVLSGVVVTVFLLTVSERSAAGCSFHTSKGCCGSGISSAQSVVNVPARKEVL